MMIGSWLNYYIEGKQGSVCGSSGIVETLNGKVCGKTYLIDNNRKVDAFLGIPYGQAERFERSKPPKSWSNVLDCSNFRERCPHVDLFLEMPFLEAPKGENCLHLNIFTPSWKPGKDQLDGFAVILFIHGGGFSIHSSDKYGDYGICKALCSKDVVVVTINYRLGYFGFLSTDDDVVPGNNGLFDQGLALKWVKENINAFGGNPNNITILGQSAGGSSADYLTLSPHTRDLFSKVIPMAGTAMHSFANVSRAKNREKCLEFARSLGFTHKMNASSKEINKAMVEFLKQQPQHKLETSLVSLFGFRYNEKVSLDLVPVEDGIFLPKKLSELRVEAPKKFVLSGTTKYEGLFLAFKPHRVITLNEAIQFLEQELANQGYHPSKELVEKILDIYLKDGDKNDKRFMTKAVINMISDISINFSQTEYSRTMTELGHTVYQYCFDYCNKKNMGLIGHAMAFRGATHCSEMAYLFHKGLLANFHPNEQDLIMVDTMTRLWTNFAKYGNPNGQNVEGAWKPLEPENPYMYYKIDLDPEYKDGLHFDRMKKWRQILSEHL
uniref:Carboxylic ester hydrolase n=1 Tax=Panagrolaimus superbus TaxID=310955 RepID=A0A914Z680_9BILA